MNTKTYQHLLPQASSLYLVLFSEAFTPSHMLARISLDTLPFFRKWMTATVASRYTLLGLLLAISVEAACWTAKEVHVTLTLSNHTFCCVSESPTLTRIENGIVEMPVWLLHLINAGIVY